MRSMVEGATTRADPAAVPARRWLATLRRDGGPATTAAIALPLLAGALLIPQALLLAGILDAAILGGQPLGALTGSLVALGAIYVLRALLGFAGDLAASH